MSKVFFFILIFTFFVSCSRKTTNQQLNGAHVFDVSIPQFKFLTAKAKFKLTSKGKNISSSAQIRIRKDSLIWVSVSPGLGIELARVLLTPMSICILDRINRDYYEYSFEEISDSLGFQFDFNMIQSSLLGTPPLLYAGDRVQKRDNYFIYSTAKNSYNFLNFIGLYTKKLEKMQVTHPAMDGSLSVIYQDFITIEDQAFPSEVLVSINHEFEHTEKLEFKINYINLQVKEELVNFPFAVSNKYERK